MGRRRQQKFLRKIPLKGGIHHLRLDATMQLVTPVNAEYDSSGGS